jgi:C4-dicarboxylate transporter DctQ subunit
MQKIWKLFDLLLKAMLYGSAFIVLVTAMAVSVDVFLRYFFSVSYAPIFELTEFGLLWMTFLGAPWVLRIKGHVNIELMTSRLGSRGRHITQVIASITSAIMLFLIAWCSVKLTFSDFKSGFELAGVLRATKWPIEIIIPIGFLSLFIQSVRNSIQLLTDKAGS